MDGFKVFREVVHTSSALLSLATFNHSCLCIRDRLSFNGGSETSLNKHSVCYYFVVVLLCEFSLSWQDSVIDICDNTDTNYSSKGNKTIVVEQ